MDDDSKRSKRLLTWTGVLAVIVGFVAIVVPAVASVGTAIFIGWLLLFAGVAMIFDAFSHGHLGSKALRLVLALLTSGAGLYLLLAPLQGTFTLTVMLVIWFIAIGFARVAGGLVSLGTPGAGLTIFSGAISLVLGILIAEELPSSADWAIGLLVGVDFVFFGMTALFSASAIGKGEPPASSTPAPIL